MHYGDMTDATNLIRIIQEVRPDEIYNLAAQSHVKVSFETPEYTANADALGTLRILEAIRILKMEERVKFYQASTSEMFGNSSEIPQKETTPFYPRSPYGAAKVYAYWITVNYREAYNLFACNGILFNHESPIRGETFVTRKITRAAARISLGLQKTLYIGNLDSRRDWGYAKDFVQAMYLMLQHPEPEDFVIATGENHTVREFIEKAFTVLGIGIQWQGKGANETGVISELSDPKPASLGVGQPLVHVDHRYFRPTEVDILLGDSGKAAQKLGWKPTVSFSELVELMVIEDLKEAQKDRLCHEAGFKTYNHSD